MSDPIKHECGIALLRLKKPLNYYHEKYGTSFYGLKKMYLLMEKQHNRGQDGAGIANVKLDMAPGQRYISRLRSIDQQPIKDIFAQINRRFSDRTGDDKTLLNDPEWLKANASFSGELFLGHLRYGTYGRNSIEACHPFLRQNNWMTRNLILAGNFNMTNVDELFQELVDLGQHPKEKADTVTILEKIGHFLDEENDRIYYELKQEGITKKEATDKIAARLNIGRILKNSAKKWDGGYAMAGLFGHGDAFVLRDPNGIRPAYFYEDDEVCVVTSERPVIQTSFNVPFEKIQELAPGHAIIIKKNGTSYLEQITTPGERKACSFERIYFSRGSDKEIYRERMMLGATLIPQVLEAVENDVRNTVFSYIPNTAETAFLGLVKGMEDHLNQWKKEEILKEGAGLSAEKLQEILSLRPRVEKIAIKDAKLRTFITDDSNRDDLVAHVYDITYGTATVTDNLVVIDDSIVRGTTLKQSILRILDRLGPKRIVIVSSAPQIRYPDCYGIDMAKMGDFIAFQAAMDLLKERGMGKLISDVYERCKASEKLPVGEVKNEVKAIYEPFAALEISDRIAKLLTPEGQHSEVKIVYQNIENLHSSCPHNLGDWYFTGNYPTPGGMRVANRSFMNFVEGKNTRAY
jgi:amidophosphoribosyltransferase